MSSPVEKSEIPPPPAYIDTASARSDVNQKRGNGRYVIGVVAVLLVAIVTAGILVGLYMQHSATKDLIKEFTDKSKGQDGKEVVTKAKVDSKNNEEDITTSDGIHVIEDYNKGVSVMRAKIGKLACYVKPLNKTGIVEPKALGDYKEQLSEERPNSTNTADTDKVSYTPATEPIEDTSFLSASAQQVCKGLDVYWLLPAENQDNRKRNARGVCRRYLLRCYRRLVYYRQCYYLYGRRICYTRYYWRTICVRYFIGYYNCRG